MTTLLLLIALRISWQGNAESYRVYMAQGNLVPIIETKDNAITLELPELPRVSVSAVDGGRESELEPVVVKTDMSCERYAERLVKTCGKKCNKEKR